MVTRAMTKDDDDRGGGFLKIVEAKPLFEKTGKGKEGGIFGQMGANPSI